jgi:hypothetical protein
VWVSDRHAPNSGVSCTDSPLADEWDLNELGFEFHPLCERQAVVYLRDNDVQRNAHSKRGCWRGDDGRYLRLRPDPQP